MRKLKVNKKLFQYNTKTTDVEVRKVSSERCCSKRYCQIFLQALTLTVQQIVYLKSFKEKRDYEITAGGQMHSIDGDIAWCGSLRDCLVPYSWHSEVLFSHLCAEK